MRTVILIAFLFGAVGCGGGGGGDPDAGIQSPDADPSCQPAALLPTQYRPIAEVSAGVVMVATTGDITSGTVDGTAGGLGSAADNPYIYLDLQTGTKVAIDDVEAFSSNAWDIAIKRSSLRTNGGDSGAGGRTLTVFVAGTGDPMSEVTTVPTTPFIADQFVSPPPDCELIALDGGEPMTAFGQWYDYDDATHIVTPKNEVYVVKRSDGTHSAFHIIEYYGDTSMPTRGAYYQVEWKDL